MKKISLSVSTLSTVTLSDLTQLLIVLKSTLLVLSIENRGGLSPQLLSSHSISVEEVAQPFRDFCTHLKKESNSKVQELSLLGNMSALNFIKALVMEVRQRELTRL